MCFSLNWLEPDIIIAICALVVSIVSIGIAVNAQKIQRTHNRKSVKPIGQIIINDYQNYISVEIRNVGIGPMLIKRLLVTDSSGEKKDNLIDFIEKEPPNVIGWSEFAREFDNRVLAVDNTVFLLAIDFEETHSLTKDNAAEIPSYREYLRQILKDLTVKIDYMSIYENKVESTSRKLTGLTEMVNEQNVNN